VLGCYLVLIRVFAYTTDSIQDAMAATTHGAMMLLMDVMRNENAAPEVGEPDGDMDGAPLGDTDGAPLGETDGDPLGDTDGDADGIPVGASVGGSVPLA